MLAKELIKDDFPTFGIPTTIQRKDLFKRPLFCLLEKIRLAILFNIGNIFLVSFLSILFIAKAFIGDKIDLNTDKVYIDRKLVTAERKKVYILLNKPRGYITTTNDPKNRKTIFDLIKEIPERVYPVGRLDYDTEGLLLLTNDGDLTFKLTHPKHQINKTYKVKCKGIINLAVIDILRSGVILDDGYKTQKAKVYVIELNKKNSLLEITIYEGKNRQIRKMFESLGHPVIRLTRTKIGDIQIGDLKSSSYRFLKKAEVNKLKNFYKKSIR